MAHDSEENGAGRASTAAEGGSPARAATGLAVRIVAVYALVGVAYILVSDWLVDRASFTVSFPEAQTIKGVGFVLVTAALLFFFSRRLICARFESQQALLEGERAAARAETEAEFRLRLIAEHARDVFWLADPEVKQPLYVSPNTARMWGYTAEQMQENPALFFRESIAPEDRERVNEAYLRAVDGPVTVEYDALHADGRRFRVQDRTIPVTDEAGRTMYVVGVSEDMTESRAAQADLAESQERLMRRVSSQQVVLEIGRLALEPLALEEFLDRSGEAIAGRLGTQYSVIMLCDPDLRNFTIVAGSGWGAAFPAGLEISRRPGTLLEETMRSDWPILIPDWANAGVEGSYPGLLAEHDIRSAATIQLPGVRRPVGALAVYWDAPHDLDDEVADFLQAAAQIMAGRIESAANERLVESLVDALDAVICLVDRDGRIRLVNAAWRRSAEIAGADATGLGAGDNYLAVCRRAAERGSEDAVQMIEGLQSVLGGRAPSFALEYACPTPETKDRVFRVTVTPMAVEGYPGAAVMHTDITEIKRTERQLQQSQKLEAIGRLTGGVAHDFNNLLTVVGGNLQLMERRLGRDADPKVARWIEISRRAVAGGSDLTQRLLAFSRRQVLEPTSIDVGRQIGDVFPLLERTLGEDVEISLHMSDDVPRIRADRAQFESALLNLAVNSRDAMTGGGRLTIEVDRRKLTPADVADRPDAEPGNYVAISVSDTGTGMSEDVLAQVFEPFFTTKSEGQGTGLGLSMVYGFMKQSGGHATIYSELGMGTCVRLYFPVWLGEEDAGEEEGPDDAAPEARPQDLTVLLVEDNATVRETALAMLEELGYPVVEAGGGPEALELLKDRPEIGLLLTDVVMPGGMSGFDLAREARRLRPEVRVVCASGFSEEALKDRSKDQWRGDAWLAKPYNIDDLARKLREAMAADRKESNE